MTIYMDNHGSVICSKCHASVEAVTLVERAWLCGPCCAEWDRVNRPKLEVPRG